MGVAPRKLEKHMAEAGVIDAARQEEFVGKVVQQISGTMTTLLGAIGDRLGLFKNFAEQGPATSAELASRTKLNERYLREWLGGMATAGYLNYRVPGCRGRSGGRSSPHPSRVPAGGGARPAAVSGSGSPVTTVAEVDAP